MTKHEVVEELKSLRDRWIKLIERSIDKEYVKNHIKLIDNAIKYLECEK